MSLLTISQRRVNEIYRRVNSGKAIKRMKEKKNKEYCTPYHDLSSIQQVEQRLAIGCMRPDQIRKIKIALIDVESGTIKEKAFKERINSILNEQFFIL